MPTTSTQRAAAVLAVLIVAAISVVASFRPGTFAFIRAVPYGDKVGHFCLFGLVSFFVTTALPGPKGALWGPMLVGLFVVVEECYQYWVPTRSFSLVDLSASLAGVVLFGAAAAMLARRNRVNGLPTEEADNPLD